MENILPTATFSLLANRPGWPPLKSSCFLRLLHTVGQVYCPSNSSCVNCRADLSQMADGWYFAKKIRRISVKKQHSKPTEKGVGRPRKCINRCAQLLMCTRYYKVTYSVYTMTSDFSQVQISNYKRYYLIHFYKAILEHNVCQGRLCT